MPGENTVSGAQPEEQTGAQPFITGVETAVTAFIGRTPGGPVNEPVAVASFADLERAFGELDFNFPVTCAVRDFFQNNGTKAVIVRLCMGEANGPLDIETYLGDPSENTGIYALSKADIFNLLCIPPDIPGGDAPLAVYRAALMFCTDNRAMLLIDPPAAWSANPGTAAATAAAGLAGLGLEGPDARNAAMYFPRVIETDPVTGRGTTLVSCGIIAGIMASTDNERGVWKAPAGSEAALRGIDKLEFVMTEADNELLNPIGINALRNFSSMGNVVWGARTLRGADQLQDEYKYIPVRRLSLYIEESLKRGLEWATFEPNDEGLWSRIRMSGGDFMQGLYTAGAFMGSSPRDSYFVICDGTTTTPDDIEQGILNVQVGFAPMKPAEFVVLYIQLIAGQG